MASPRFQRARAHRFARYVGGNITLNSTSWANVHASAFDLTLEAQVGDVLVATPNFRVSTEAVDLWFDAVTVVSGTVTNSFSRAGAVTTSPPSYGVPGWKCVSGIEQIVVGGVPYTVVAGDIVDGRVTVRLRYVTATATNRTMNADGTNWPAFFMLQNIGPQDPE